MTDQTNVDIETPEDRLVAALGPEPDTTELTPLGAEEALAAWREQWVARNLDDADYAARRLQQTRARVGTVDALAARRIAQISEWAERERARYQPDVAYWSGRLEAFHRTARAADEKHAKTVALPCGVELRSQAGKIKTIIVDAGEAVAWLEQHHAAAIRFPPAEIDKVEVQRAFGAKAQAEKDAGTYPAVTADGEIVPGIELVRSDVGYTIS